MKQLLFLIIIGYNLFSVVFSQEWQYLGLKDEEISTITVDWSNPNVIYAGSRSNFSSGTVGGIFKTTNGGITWDTLIRGVTTRTIALHPSNSNIIYATLGINFLTQAGIVKSTDAGITWNKADFGITISPTVGPGAFGIDPKHPDTLYTGTSGNQGGKFYRSTDGGKNWYPFEDSTNRLGNGVTAIAIDPNNSNVIYAGTAGNGSLLRSTNCGIGWEILNFPNVGKVHDIMIDPTDSQIIYCGAWFFGIFKTIDMGKTWFNLKEGLPDTSTIDKIEISADTNKKGIFIISNWNDYGGVFQSESGGNWLKIGIDSNRINTIKLFESILYLGYNGIYKKEISTTVFEETTFLLKDFALDNNFPNPFNGTTSITYEINKPAMINLKIYDTNGKKIKTLVKKNQTIGKYTISWSGQNDNNLDISSGMYFIVLQVNERVVVKKILLIK